ncbi:THUMP domain-containing protein 2 isoform X2 [Ambystoma mexicanum]|uniref:THUMP domain-containing protein 2 isoform X2 n=1 Tax=Ambystoma mexicanum TaxID=8296 RepID=UPI0037E785B0
MYDVQLLLQTHSGLGDQDCIIGVKVECILGKIFFTAKTNVSKLREIKSGERLFLLLRKQPPLTLSCNRGRGFNELKKKLIGEPCSWLDAVSIWQNLQSVSKYKLETESNTKALKRKSSMDSEVDLSEKLKKPAWEANDASQCLNDCQKNSSQDRNIDEHGMSTILEAPANFSEDTLPTSNRQHDFGFRVSCRCSGALGKIYTAEELGRMIGIAIIKEFGWKADLRNPDLEIFVHLNDEHSIVGFPLLRAPLASRAYIRSAGLRSTIAWAMASVAEISVGALVLDPMCGLGTILLEAAKEWPEACYLGIDLNKSPLQGAYDNVKAAGLTDCIELLQASAAKLPLLSESVDVVVSDIPFGKKFRDVQELFPCILEEIQRVLRVGGTVVLLLSQALHKQLLWHISGSHRTDRPLKAVSDEPSRAEMMNDSNPEESPRSSPNTSSASRDTRNDTSGGHMRWLKPAQSYCVSLGVTEAVIFKCKKVSAVPVR